MFTKRLLGTADIFGAIAPNRQSASDLFAISGASSSPLHECYFDENSASDLPAVIIPHKDDDVGFFADVATYYPAWSPVSAHVHVLRSDQIADKAALTRTKSKAKPIVRLTARSQLKIWSALTYVEAASLGALRNLSGQEPAYSLCRRTLTFAIARASVVYPDLPTVLVASQWSKLREISSGELNPALIETIVFLAALVRGERMRGFEDRFPHILPALCEYIEGRVNEDYLSSYLLGFHPAINIHVAELVGDFDRRMEVFQSIVELVRIHPHNELIDTVTVAFFANRILPGSMRYSKVLARLLGTYGTVLIWYGFFSSVSEKYGTDSVAIATDRKIQRDIARPFDLRTSPMVDVSIDELQMLYRSGLKATALRPVQPRSIFVSLLPGIDVYTKLGDEASGLDARDAEIQSHYRQRDRLLVNLLAEAQRILGNPVVEEPAPTSNNKGKFRRY